MASLARSMDLERRLNDSLGLTPHLGWSSWNVAQCDAASEKYALETANKFIELGLKDVGYEYVNIDDCWSTRERDESGNLVPDPSKWPNGIKAVVDQIHDMGLKFGLYGCAGELTCASFPGSWGHEIQDAELIASWGVDFWKHDNCFTPCTSEPFPQTCWEGSIDTRPWYGTMRDAILSVKDSKEMLFNLCNWGRNEVWTWGYDYGHSWRIEGDNWGDWESVVRIGAKASEIPEYSGPGGFNDLDMLFVGNGVLTEPQERLHFGLWAIAKSPLVIGADLNALPESSLKILSNKDIIDVNQDPLGIAAGIFQPPNAPGPVRGEIYPYWAGPLSDGVVIGLVSANRAGTLSVNFADVPGLEGGSYNWKELYTGEEGTGESISFNVAENDIAIVKVTTS
ncbi:alpha-galactosidase B-like protein [Hapsidospora chrysogenum ATCC 11550]|uniref:Alpha-galactosidase n=1 Tax=Hapsidospora chrysogenum (strain ATCC 11550 / CBS 779.69 / DSM 880 / IAM 14645 / JCM 23072 / IMI 49137) TaxID=857340 RepID=A0A086SWQ1_HAPC1|nr:alpha-galactosidase B-like protein [Hapsidospora chrysogenum ATCC 11550]